MNNAIFVGRATADGDCGVTKNGNTVGRFSVAVDRGYGDNKVTDYISCTVFGTRSESVPKCIKKGAIVSVSGVVSCHCYEKNGEHIAQMDLAVSDFKVEMSKKTDSKGPNLEDYSGNVPF